MTPAARLQAAAEILDEIVAASEADGAPADAIVTRYFKTRRYAGSGDRRAVRELVFRAIRRSGERPASGRAAVIGLAEDDPALAQLFGEPRGPPARGGREFAAHAGLLPQWIEHELSPLVSATEWPALLERAPLDLRVNVARASRDEVLAQFPDGEPTPLSPWGIRMPADSRVDQHPAYGTGLVEVQDEGSQLIALACKPQGGQRILDLCAAKLPQRAGRAGATIETRLLSPPNELVELDDWKDGADLVLVDAPCSGSGTWRRSPEGRWRLTPERLERVTALQAHLLDMAAAFVRPGGSLVYAVCSILSREGAGQIAGFLDRHSSWIREETPIAGGRADGAGKLLSPGHDATDGFFIARLARPC